MSKIGRNDKCPCGSGLKYKNCCIDKETFSNIESFDLRHYFKQFHTLDLIASLSALSINPANHGKNCRLDYLILEALATTSVSTRGITSEELFSMLTAHFPHFYLEDPPENLFTENIIFATGNNTAYGGNFEQGGFTLNNLIKVVNYYRDSLPHEFVKVVMDSYHLLLLLSGSIASRVGHKRNMTGGYRESPSEIQIPDKFEKFKNALWFDLEWINDYCLKLHIDSEVLKYFTIQKSDIKLDEIRIENMESNPVLTKVLLKLEDGFLVIAPVNIISALVHFTWVQAETFGCKKEVTNLFHKTIWSELEFYFRKIGFKRVDFTFDYSQNLPIKYLVYQFDSDKLAFLSVSYDECDQYDKSTPCHSDPMLNLSKARDDRKSALEEVVKEYESFKLLEIDLYSSIGRYYTIAGGFGGNYGIMTSVYRFLVWAKSADHDKMSLWYFKKLKDAFSKRVRISPFVSFLDLFSLYRHKKESFYLNDERPPTDLMIPPGECFDLIRDSIVNVDEIVVYYLSNQFSHPILVPVVKVGDFISRYANKETRPDGIEFYVPELPFDFWVKSYKKFEEMKERFHVYSEFSETICYWILQVRNELSQHLEPLRKIVVDLIYEYEDKFELLGEEEKWNSKDPNLDTKFTLKVDKSSISLFIPSEIDTYIGAPDNDGERILLKNILVGFGTLLEQNGKINTLTDDVIDGIIEMHASRGLKKMLLLIHTGKDVALDPRYLDKPRYVQEPPEQLILDEIIPLLGKKCPAVGEILDKSSKGNLIKNIVLNGLLPRLRKTLSGYHSVELLKKFMSIYEALLHANALRKLRTPTRMLCFQHSEDIIQELQKEITKSDETSLAVRCIIEHLAAEPTNGTNIVTTELIDEVISTMSLIIFWGSQGVLVKHELFDVKLAVLESGRIGTNSNEIQENFFKSFSKARAQEFLHEAEKEFSKQFNGFEKSRNPVPVDLDEAFIEQFGISLPKLGGILGMLTQIGLEQEIPVAQLLVTELKIKIKESFDEPFSDKEIDSAIEFLALKSRSRVDIVPSGFHNNDISPWRYNRRLSYLQKPLILLDYGEYAAINTILWSPRSCSYAWVFLNELIVTGRYKAPEKSKLESSISKISQQRRKKLQHKAVLRLSELSNGIILDQEVGIRPSGKLKNKDDIGDIDIFLIDQNRQLLLSIECKRTEPSRNVKEMAEELEKYLDPKKGYIKKHLRRHTWIEKNKNLISTTYSVDCSDFIVHSLFITNEVLSIQFMKSRKLLLPIFSMYDLSEWTFDTLISNIKRWYELSLRATQKRQ